jgi:protease I
MKKKVLILTGDFADDYELYVPYSTLKSIGFEVNVICPDKKKGEFIKTSIHYVSENDWDKALQGKAVTYSERLGHPFRIQNSFKWENIEEEVQNYEALIIPGGRAPEYIAILPNVQKIVSYFIETNKPIGAICHGIQVLTHADNELKKIDYLRGKQVFPYPSLNLESKLLGAKIAKNLQFFNAVKDGNLVTAPTWQALPDFMKKFIDLLNDT